MADAKKTINRTGGRKTTSARRSSKQPTRQHMPRWQYIALSIVITSVTLFFAYHLFLKQVIYRFAPCDGLKVYETCIPGGHAVYGIDISHHQGKIDWKELKEKNPKEAPVSFIYMKASEGSDHKDKQFDNNWKNAKKYGFTRGAYHYFGTRSTGLAQAKMFIKTVQLESGDLPPVVDVEEKTDNMNLYIQELKIFIAEIEKHYGVKPIIYSGKKYKTKYLSDRYFDRFPIWIAHYYVDSLKVEQNWMFWQCSDKGRLPGIRKNVDINIFNGDLSKLENHRIK